MNWHGHGRARRHRRFSFPAPAAKDPARLAVYLRAALSGRVLPLIETMLTPPATRRVP